MANLKEAKSDNERILSRNFGVFNNASRGRTQPKRSRWQKIKFTSFSDLNLYRLERLK